MTLLRPLAAGFLCGLALVSCRTDVPIAPRTAPNSSSFAITAAATPQLSLAASTPANGRYLVVFKQGGSAGPAISDELRANGGTLEGIYDQLGFAVVSGISADAAARLGRATSVSSVESDIEFAIEPAHAEMIEGTTIGDGLANATAPQKAALFAWQWNMRAIAADAAWAGGHLGSSSVSVAILDTGIDYRWPDLAGRVDLTRSISLRPDEDARLVTWFGNGLHPITDLNAHGTLVSALVASNSLVFAGVTTRTTLFGVKVCIIFNTCSTLATINGIAYAVDHGADVINMSLGGGFPKNAAPGLVSIFNRVFNYAKQHGTLIVVAAGNEAMDLDHNGNFYSTYCNSPHVICVSATAPTAAPTLSGPFTNPDAIAPYTNFGRSAIDLAAPGGGIPLTTRVAGPCSETALDWHQPPRPTPTSPLPPPVIDGPACPLPLLFFVLAAGTSFSAPHVTGAAASLVAVMGPGNPAQIRSRLIQSADDLGDPGTDPFYGKGRLNVARAVGVIP